MFFNSISLSHPHPYFFPLRFSSGTSEVVVTNFLWGIWPTPRWTLNKRCANKDCTKNWMIKSRNFWNCIVSRKKVTMKISTLSMQTSGKGVLLAEVFYYVNYVNVNYSVKNSTVDCKYLRYFLWVSRCFF